MELFIKRFIYCQIKSKIMRATVLLTLCNLLTLYATGFSQSTLTMKGDNVTLKNALVQIEENAQVKFVYRDETINDFNVSFDFQNTPVEESLKTILKGTGSTYHLLDNNLIVISPIELLQGITVTGMVADKDGPLPGVNVTIKGSTLGIVTNAGGNYSLTVPDANTVLVFSFVGYATQEIVVGSQRMINVELVEDFQTLEEVVVVGYSTQRKSDIAVVVFPISNMDKSWNTTSQIN